MKMRAACSHRRNLATRIYYSGALEYFVKTEKEFYSTKSQILKCLGKPIYADKLPDKQSDEQPAEQHDSSPEVYSWPVSWNEGKGYRSEWSGLHI